MRLTRVYVDSSLSTGQQLTVTGSALNHISRVLRLRAGDAVTLFNGQGGDYGAKIEAISRDKVIVQVGEHRTDERESPFALTLAQGVSRGERMDWVVQKATELGVARLVPVFTERSIVQLDERQAAKKVQHWRSIAVSACEQCGRNRVPDIAQPVGVFDMLESERGGSHLRLLLSPSAGQRIVDLPAGATGATVFIGPEGGLANVEHESAQQAGFTPVRLGPRVLRTETAAVCALTLLQQQFGDL